MGRFKAGEEDKYGGQGGGGYFRLQNDKDTARVRFMYRNIDDVEGYAVHQVEIGDKKRYVNCLRNYGDPIDSCPFCREKYFQSAKLFVPVYDVDNESVKIWERGKKFFSKLSSMCARYANGSKELVSHVFEIERNGKSGDTQTSYEIYEVDEDGVKLEDLPEVPDVLGGIVLDKSADDMEYYIENGSFPPDDNDRVVRRNASSTNERPVRRTPSNNRGDKF